MSTKNSSVRIVAAVFDLDGTITRTDTYLAFLMGFLANHQLRILRCLGLPFAVAAYRLRLRDNSWLKSVFLRAIAGGISRRRIETWSEAFAKRIHTEMLRPEALKAIQAHRDSGHHLLLATASFDFYAVRLARTLGFDAVICTRSSWTEDGLLKGDIDGLNCYGIEKAERVKKYFEDLGGCRHITAYSDHHSDLPLLRWADKAIAINPTKRLQTAATMEHLEVQDWGG